MTNKKNAISIVAFGDSITAAVEQEVENRWPEIVRRMLLECFPDVDITLVNAGVGGNTTREGLRRIEHDVLRHNPDIVLVEFGNDVTEEPERHVDFDEFTANLDLIRTKVAQRSEGRIILSTFTPIIDHWGKHSHKEHYQSKGGPDAFQELYRELTRQFAAANAVPLVDVGRAMKQAIAERGPEEYMIRTDGVHLTAAGNRLVANLVFERLAPEIKKITSEKHNIRRNKK